MLKKKARAEVECMRASHQGSDTAALKEKQPQQQRYSARREVEWEKLPSLIEVKLRAPTAHQPLCWAA
jgi:hypothetical protein